MLTRVAEHTEDEASGTARATLEHMRELATSRAATLIERPAAATPAPSRSRKRRNVYDAQYTFSLPGKLAMSEHTPRSAHVEVKEAYDGSGATYDFFAKVFRRSSIDGRGMRLDSTVHYGTSFENALWNGRQMVYGHADGRIFTRFTASVDVIAHELTHGVTQHSAALGYHGQTGALNEHLADAFGIMVKQYMLGQDANESDWRIGAEILGPAVNGVAVRSMAAPGTAYDDPILGRDPQPSHMRDYVETIEDNGGVHINSGILNHGFYRAARAIGGKTWKVLGWIWYAALTDRLKPEADFADFVQATVDLAGELFGNGGRVQRIVYDAWAGVGLSTPVVGCAAHHTSIPRPRQRAATHNKRVSRKENTP
ncbi:MAG TPA: M4 family metallopeptidase [Thermoanaerobaculia bacterium]|nr:M4 family metallopeptidase [Thermoanaerobaculia bacterium]